MRMKKSELELIIETIPDAVVVINGSGNIIFANRAAETILGLNRSAIRTRSYNAPSWDITTVDGEPYPEEKLPFALVMKHKKPVYCVEHAVKRPGGKRIILSINAAPLMDEKDNVESVVASLTDITEAKMTELALKESESRFRELLREIDFAAVILDIEGRIKFANDYILEVTGFNWGSVKDKVFFKTFVSENQKEAVEKRYFEFLAKGKTTGHYELTIKTATGELRSVLFSNAVLHDAAGNITGVAGIGEDITEQKRAAEEVRESRKQVLDILESITDGFFALDNDWRFTYVNHRAEEIFGIRREDLLYKGIWQVIRKDQSPEIYHKYHQSKEQMMPVVFEEFSTRLNKWLEMHVYPYRKGISVYIKDVTDRKRAEKERAFNIHFLESMDRVNRTILAASDLGQMMSDVLEVILSAFDCDRTYLLYPCDPESPSWSVPMEQTKPEFPGLLALGTEMPMDQGIAVKLRTLLSANRPFKFGPGSRYPLPPVVVEKFGTKSIMAMALHPKVGKPWEFGLQQCSYPRIWTPEEERLFQEIGRRLQDSLTSLLVNRELQEGKQELQHSNDLLEAIIEAAPAAIMGLDLDGNVKHVWNPAAERMLGWSKEEAIGHHLPSVTPEKEEEFLEFRKRIRQGLSLNGVEVRRRRRDGTPIDYSIYAAPLHDAEGNITGNIAILVDITERKRAERRIMLLSFALDHVKEAAYVTDENARFIYANEEASRLLGHNRDELLGGMTVFDIDIEMTQEAWRRHWQELRENGTIIFERLHRSEDGRMIPVEVNANLFNFEGVDYNLAMVHDVTERKQVEVEYAANLRYFENMDRVNQAMLGTGDAERMMNDILDVVLSVFNCDRAFLMHPCDPDAPSLRIEVERSKPECAGASTIGIELPMDPGTAEFCRVLVDAGEPVQFEAGSKHRISLRMIERFNIKSQLAVAIYPRVLKGKPWIFGIQQCSHPRVWSQEKKRLFNSIGRRLADVLTSLLIYRDLQESEQKYRHFVDTANEGIWAIGPDALTTFVNAKMAEMLGYSKEEIIGRPVTDFIFNEDKPMYLQRLENRRKGISENFEQRLRCKDGSALWVVVSANPILNGGNNFAGAFDLVTDITESKRIKDIMQARLRLLEFSESHSMEEFLTATLNEIEALTGSKIGFYHFLEADQITLSLQAWSTNTLKRMCTAEGKGSHYDVNKAGVWVDCVHERRPVIHNDYASLSHRKGMPEGHAPVTREAVVPIFRDNLIKAIIGIGNKIGNYNETDIDTLYQLGDISWDIVERKRTEEELKRSNRELKAITRCDQALVRAESEQVLLDEICRIICNEAGYRMAWVGYVEHDEGKTVRPVAWAGFEEGYLADAKLTWADTERGRGPTGIATREGRSATIQDFTIDKIAAPWRKEALKRSYRSSIALPLKEESGKIFGVLTIYSVEPNVFDSNEIRLMEELASDLAFGIAALRTRVERKQAEEALRESEEKFRTIFQNSPIGVFRTTIDGHLLEVNPYAARMLGYDSPEEAIREVTNLAEQVYGRAGQRQEVIDELHESTGVVQATGPFVRRGGEKAFATLHLRMMRDDKGKPIYLEGIAEDMTERMERERFTNALNEINLIINSTLNFDEVMQQVIDRAAIAMGTETGAIIFREGDHWHTRYSYGYKENIIGVILTDEEAPHATRAARIKKPVVINDAFNDPMVNREIMKKYNIRSVITVPLIAGGVTVGILFLNYHSAPIPFSEAQIDFADKLSVSISLAIQNARLYETEHNIADTLQEALLAVPEQIEGIEYSYLYRSASETAKVGGDFFDVFEIDDGRIGVIVGDVSGKGLQASSLTSLVKNTVRVYAYEELSPSVIMKKANDVIRRSIPSSNFITLFLGIIDKDSGVLTYCSAGHPPAIIKKENTVELLAKHSPILGAFQELEYVQDAAVMQKGDILVLYTDGITEARRGKEFFGEERLARRIEDFRGMNVKKLPDYIFNKVLQFTGGKLFDDVVLFALTLTGVRRK
jgi:PAS domain S-box-containing protein